MINGAGNRFQQFDDYHRGIPQTIRVPGRYDGSTTSTTTRVVDDNGWIISETDYNGIVTRSAYDQRGRVAALDRSNSDETEWSDILVKWGKDSGIPIKTTLYCSLNDDLDSCVDGSARFKKTESYNGKLQLTQVEQKDLGNPGPDGTRYNKYRYNTLGRKVFESYPSNNLFEDNGTSYDYDSLGRLKVATETSTGNRVVYEYLPGSKVSTVDPKGYETVTTYLARGRPDASLPTRIVSPEGVTTDLVYDSFDNLESVNQGGFEFDYIYDDKQRLCKVSRPGLGSHYFGYGYSNEVAWEAQGISSTAEGCDREIMFGNADSMISHTHDNLGEQWITSYADSTPDHVSTRDDVGNLLDLSFGNNSWTYTYNHLNLVETENLERTWQRALVLLVITIAWAICAK